MILSTTAASRLMTANIDNSERSIDHLQELLFESKCTLLGFARCYPRCILDTVRYGEVQARYICHSNWPHIIIMSLEVIK